MTSPLNTERLILRQPIPDDAEFYAALENDPQVKRFVGGPSGHSAERYRQNAALPPRTDGVLTFTVVERYSGTCIGRAGILPVDEEAVEVHCVLAKEHWAKGFGLEIVAALLQFCKQHRQGKKVIGKVHPDNESSIRITRKLGFREEGLVESDGFDNGFRRLILE